MYNRTTSGAFGSARDISFHLLRGGFIQTSTRVCSKINGRVGYHAFPLPVYTISGAPVSVDATLLLDPFTLLYTQTRTVATTPIRVLNYDSKSKEVSIHMYMYSHAHVRTQLSRTCVPAKPFAWGD